MRHWFTFLISVFFASIVVAQVPVAQFTASSTSVCAGTPITFSDQSNYGGATIISTNWDFGEGGKSSNRNPTYTFANPGVYQILLTVISSGGTDFELKLKYITVNPNPIASFSFAGNGCTVPYLINFANNSTSGASMNYSWDFGNGQTSNLKTPTVVTYNSVGTYPVKLDVTNSTTGCKTSTNQNVIVTDFKTDATVPILGCVDVAVNCTDASTIGTDTWTWTTDDGQTSSIQNPTFTFHTPGNHTVTLTSENSITGCSGVQTKNIVIHPTPIPTFTVSPVIGCAPLLVTYTNTSGAGIFHWDFGNGQTSFLKNPPIQSYDSDGYYPVNLTMTDIHGCIGSTTIDSMIFVSPPVAKFGAKTFDGCSPLPVQFVDSSTAPDPIGDPIVSWLWDFGDGSTFSGQTPPIHTYNSVGVYDVSLTITTKNGCTETSNLSKYIQVGKIDLVDFSLFPINECTKKTFTFTDLSVISTPHDSSEVKYKWDFGDKGSSTKQNPTYNYPVDTGFFDVQLIVNFRGCRDTLMRPKQVYIRVPISKFVTQSLYCNPASLPLTVNVTDNAISGTPTDNVDMTWRWNDGTPDDIFLSPDVFDSDKGNISHVYTSYGTYKIRQLIHNYTSGCRDSSDLTIHITTMDAQLALTNDTVCSDLPLTLTSNSVFRDPAATFWYDMGNGDTLVGSPVDYTYTKPGTYKITFIAKNVVGCSDTVIIPAFKVLSPPTARLTANVDAGCLPLTASYTNTSTAQGNGVQLTKFNWTFPDGTTQQTTKINETTHFDFTSEGDFTTSLVAEDTFGCVSPPAKVSMKITKPKADFKADSVVCDLEQLNVTNSTSGFGFMSYTWNLDGVFSANSTDYSTTFDETPSNAYTNVPHTITLVATDGNGCKDSISKTVRVALPIANLSYVASGATANASGQYNCPPVFETFTDLSVTYGSISTWNWVFGDDKSSHFQDPSNTYIFPGTYTLSLEIKDEFGCTADTTLKDYLTILGPKGDLTSKSIGDSCIYNYLFTATNLSFVDSIIWDLDDGTKMINNPNFTHIYTLGTYNPTATLVDSLNCKVVYPMDPVVVRKITISSKAGSDQTICGSSTTMAGNVDPNGSGVWTLFSGTGTIAFPNSPTSAVSGITVGEHVFVWTMMNSCDTISDTVVITRIGTATVAITGPDQANCIPTANLIANSPVLGTGLWTLASGTGTITNPTDPLSGVTGMLPGVNKFVWTISNFCTTTSDTLTITYESLPSKADAGSDQAICIPTTNLKATLPSSGTGVWSILSGSAQIINPTSPTSTITNLAIGETYLIWTVINTCGTSSDTVKITRETNPTNAFAGSDQTLCVTRTNLGGNVPVIGLGAWSLASGTGVIADASNPNTQITGMAPGINKFVWTISNSCRITRDTVLITVETFPSQADAGPDQMACIPTAVFAGNNPLIGRGFWTLYSGVGTITNPLAFNSTITGLPLGPNEFIWTISNTCGNTSDTVKITGVDAPTNADAGTDQFICSTSTTIHANKPHVGIGKWTLISGVGTITNPSDSITSITDLGVGNNVFQWEIASFCGNDSDQVTIKVETPPTVANAGLDVALCGDSINLSGNNAVTGTGTWTLISGEGIIESPHSETSKVTKLAVDTSVFEWTIENSCATSSSRVAITRVINPTPAKVGNDSTFCSSSSELFGNKAVTGSGRWTVVEGTGVISNPTDSIATVSGMSVGTNTFRWTISNLCNSSTNFDEVTYTIEGPPTVADAGPDQPTVCNTSTQLSAAPVEVGEGTWSLVSGAGIIDSVHSESPQVTNLGLGANIFKWTVANTCDTIFDIVKISRFIAPTVATASSPDPICMSEGILTGNSPSVGIGTWSLVTGSGTIVSPTDSVSEFTNLGVGTNVFRWTIFNGCGSTYEDVSVTVETEPTVSIVGPDQTICGDFAILSGNKPISGKGEWTLVSGKGSINSVSDPTTGVSDLGIGSSVFRWTIANSCDTSSMDLTVTSTGACPNQDSLDNILTYFIPNTFTPNSDAHNQTFQPVFTSGYEPLKYTFYVFDRWGELIFESHDANIGWKGTFGKDDRIVQDGVYTWKISYVESSTQKESAITGHVLVIK